MNLIAHFQDARNVISVPAGAVIFREGASPTCMYLLLDGSAGIVVGETLVEQAEAGSLLGEMALVDVSPRSATVIASTDCRLVPIDARQFDMLVRETPEFARHVMGVLAERLRRMNDRLTDAVGELTVRIEAHRSRTH